MGLVITISIIAFVLIFFMVLLLSIKKTPYGDLNFMVALLLKYNDFKKRMDFEPGWKREKIKADINIVKGKLAPVFKIEEHSIDCGSYSIPARVFYPTEGKNLPVLVYFHGGGFVIGDLDDYENICRKLCFDLGAVVVAPQCRQAPEYPFPAAVKDSYAAYLWTHKNIRQISGDPKKVALGGDSAGGNLAVVTAIQARDAKGPAAAALLLFYPWLNPASMGFESYKKFKEGFMLTVQELDWFRNCYAPKGTNLSDIHISPMNADLSHLPPTLILSAEFDILHDEGEAFAAKLENAGVRVKFHTYRGHIHGFLSMTGILKKQIAGGYKIVEESFKEFIG